MKFRNERPFVDQHIFDSAFQKKAHSFTQACNPEDIGRSPFKPVGKLGWLHGRRRISCEVFDHHPAQAAVEGLPLPLSIPAGAWAELSYRLRPVSRGDLHFGPVELRQMRSRVHRAAGNGAGAIPAPPPAPPTRCRRL